jgi:glycosyltransferase involved in cell wall biosynthesis
MRICIDVRYGLASGASTYMANLVNALIDAGTGHEMVLLQLQGSRPLTDRQVESIEAPRLSPLKQCWWVQRHLADRLRAARIDVYHSLKHLGPFKADCKQIYSMSSLGGYVGYRSGIYPMPVTEHVYWRYLGRQWLRRLDWLITCASFIGEHIASRFRFPADRITCIPFGRDPYFSPGSNGDRAGRAGGSPILLQVANVLPVKNTVTLVSAFSQLHRDFPDLRLVICGDQSHPYFEEVKSLAARLKVLDCISFMMGVTREQLRDLYRSATVFVLPSLHEGCPLALMEAMACGKPCVTSDRAGLPELGGDAVLRYENATDSEALAKLLARVLSDSNLGQSLSGSALQRAQDYTWERAANKTLEVYDSLRSG